MSQIKTIRVSNETYNELAQCGDLRDSFDTVIKRLIIKSRKEGSVTAE
jgi:predicted CopG family antitoxin